MSQDGITSLPQAIKNALESRLVDLHTAMPGLIVKYDSDKQIADVQPLIKRVYFDGRDAQNLSIISEVPVIHPRTANTYIHFPIKPGDKVLLVFNERSIDKYLLSGNISDPEEIRKHDLKDAVAIPGFFAEAGAFSPDNPNNLEIAHFTNRVSLSETGIKLKDKLGATLNLDSGKAALGKSPVEILDKLATTLAHLDSTLAADIAQAHLGNLGYATSPPINVAVYTAVKAAATATKGLVNSIKGSL